ncbi:MAG: ATP-grasp enzyme [Leptolyngbyaceae cyanobacterium SM1_3_5]|nr:ATP-grasp enzyme [Leptolyngbyaceae cyanobacterium SM1_3_5]
MKNFQSRLAAIFQNLATLTALLIALPFNLSLVLGALVGNWIRGNSIEPQTDRPKTILLTGGKMTKALQLARSFHKVGHRVILAETHKYWLTGHQFSNAIDRFHTIPAPQKDPEGYVQALLAIVKQEQVDVYVPVCSPVQSYYDSFAKSVLSGACEVFHFDPDVTRMLDDKFAFAEAARAIDLSVPKSFLITNPQQVLDFDFSNETRPYILKSIPYDSVRRLDLTKLPCPTRAETEAFVRSLPISEEKPWIMQEFISGQEFCTHSTVRNGELRLHCCCESSAFQVNYEQVDQPEILQWVSQFVQAQNLSGQASFDFIQAEDGPVYAIECNPRTHSAITMFYNHFGVADAYLNDELLAEPLQPLPTSKPTYWIYHEVWRLNEVRSISDLRRWWQTIWQGKDAIFEPDDPLPFLMVHHWQIPLLLLGNLRRMAGWIRIDFNIGKLVEIGGD